MHTTSVIYKYTAVLQVFKFHKKEEEGGERGKLKTKTQQIKQQTNKQNPQNIEKQNKREKQTQVYRSETTALTESHTVCGMYIDYRGDDTEGGGGHICVSACSRRLATHTQEDECIRVHTHTPHRLRTPPHTHSRTLHGSSTHTDMPVGNGRRAVGYHQSASSSM